MKIRAMKDIEKYHFDIEEGVMSHLKYRLTIIQNTSGDNIGKRFLKGGFKVKNGLKYPTNYNIPDPLTGEEDATKQSKNSRKLAP